MKVTNLSTDEWTLTAPPVARGKARRGRGATQSPPEPRAVLPAEFLPAGAVIGAAGKAEMVGKGATRGTRSVAPLELAVETPADERVVLAVRLPSGALRFVAPVDRSSRGPRTKNEVSRFVISPPRGRALAARRGLVSDAIEWVAVKIGKQLLDKVAGKAIGALAAVAERKWWGQRREGLYRVESAGAALQFTAVKPEDVSGPALLLLHGTFSHAEAAFADLRNAPGDFFAAARREYGENIYAWNHFTVSKSPEDNVRELLAALPARSDGVTFDVITHSRGGLVLRTLAERPLEFHENAGRFRLRRAVLVAAPNAGTPLATPDRWEETLGFVSNVMELFTPNPWATGAAFVADGLVWLAARIAGNVPGLASMDAAGETIAALQESSVLDSGSYAALAANFHPTESIFQWLLDAGVDAFFQGANDLVVPAEGSWLADGAGELIPAERIGCFGRGGNLEAEEAVHHLNFFRHLATVDFLKRSLGLPVDSAEAVPLDPATRLPTRTLLSLASRRGMRGGAAPGRARLPVLARVGAVPAEAALALPEIAYADRTLHLMILEAPVDETAAPPHPKMIIATYSNARVVEAFPTKSPKAPGPKAATATLPTDPAPDLPGHRFQRIIALHERIRMCLNGKKGRNGIVPQLPTDAELSDLGEWLFRALFIGDVRRLYDAARAEQHGRPLNIVLTSTVPWIAGLPWEFAYDPMRRKYLASEEVHFTRGVMAAVPAEVITRRSQKLRLLVVSAQPADASLLSIEEEQERIQHAFRSLTESGLVGIEMLMDASPDALQEHIMGEQVQGRSYDVVHFIGHGEYEPDAAEGRLLLIGADGRTQELEVRPLREMLCSRGIHLVFLNACESGVAYGSSAKGKKEARPGRGIAQALVEGGLPAVVANQYTVLDASALAFADSFYRALALGSSLGQAAREARIALNYAVDGEAIDWAVPVLYARDPDARLCAPTLEAVQQAPRRRKAAARQTGDSMLRGARSPVQGDRIRVGVADISKYFPQLPKILARLNTAQSAFEFVPVEAAIPLGVWEQKDLGPTKGDKVRYLWADRFGEKMKRHPERLGVHYLICATNHMMRDNQIYNLYGWWSSTKDCRVMLFSTGGLALPRDGQEAGRVVSNAFVQLLGTQLAEEAGAKCAIHEKGPKNCPFYFNEERLGTSLTGVNKFDANCRRYLRQRIPETVFQIPRADILKSLNQILACFAKR